MPQNIYNMQPSSFYEISDDLQSAFFPEGTLLSDKDGNSYRARDIREQVSEDGEICFEKRQFYTKQDAEGATTLIRELSLAKIRDLQISVVWYPEK